jgi:hypothetical protein
MMDHVYRIKFDKSSFDLNDEYERLSDHEKQKISNLDAESFFDYQDYKDRYICYVICKPTEIQKYSSILIQNLISHEISDLSKDILKFKIDLELELKPLLSTINSIKYSFFIDDINDWILQHLNIDDILDRISELGNVDKLSEVEKEFLKNFQLP